MIKGAYEIDSQPGKGTSLRFMVPLHPQQQLSLGTQ
jgi:hypothetical protein